MKKLLGVVTAVGVTLLMAAPAFADTPAYTVDSASQTAITNLIDSLVTGLLGVIPIAIQHAAPFLVTLVVIFFLWAVARHFMGR